MRKLSPVKFLRLCRRSSDRAIAFSIILALSAFASPAMSQSADGLPAIVGRDAAGNLTSLKRTFAGKPMLINFWWVQCSPCKQELPDLIAKEQAYPHADFIYVHAETNPKTKSAYEVSAVTDFLKRENLELSNVIISNTKARLSAGVEALPTTMLVGTDGKVDIRLAGFTDENTKKIKEWLQSTKP